MQTGELYPLPALIFCAGSAAMDIRTAKIDNGWILTGACAAVLCQVMQPDEVRLTGFFIPLAILFPFFLFRAVGGGDVKLLCVTGMFMGVRSIGSCMLWSFILAAVLSLAVMIDDGCARERFGYLLGYLRRRVIGNGRTDGSGRYAERYIRSGMHRENIHLAVPVFAAVLLWFGGLY